MRTCELKREILIGLSVLFLLLASHSSSFAQCPPTPGISLTVNEFQYAITSGNPSLTNYVEVKGPAGQSLTCVYLLAFDANCGLIGAQDLSSLSIPASTSGGSDAGYFVVAQDATKYSNLYGRTAELEAAFPDLNDGPASVQIRFHPTQLSKGTLCSSVGGALYDAVGYASSAGTAETVFGGETQEINPGLAVDAGGSVYRVSDQDTQNNHEDFAAGSQPLATPGLANPGAVILTPTKVDFSDTTVGGSSAALSVTLANAGATPLSISNLGSTGSNSSDFIVNDNCPRSPSTLAVGASCRIDITFEPAQAGLRNADLSISDSASGSPHIAPLSGNGVSGPACIFCDDFQDGNLTSPLWTAKGAVWGVVSGNATVTSTKKSTLTSPNFGGCSLCTFETNVEVSSGGTISLFAWNHDSKNNVEIRLAPKKLLVKQKTTAIAVSSKAIITIAPNVFHKVKATYDGAHILVSLDDVDLITLTPVSAPGGNVSFQVKPPKGITTTGAIADISIY